MTNMHPILSDISTQFEAVRREKLTKRAVADLGRYERIHKTLTIACTGMKRDQR